MIAPCQSANEGTLLLFIEITLAIDGRVGIESLLIASSDLACPFIYIFFAHYIRAKQLLLTVDSIGMR